MSATPLRSTRAAPTRHCGSGCEPPTITFHAIEDLADQLVVGVGHDDGPLTRHKVHAIAGRMGFTLESVTDLPSSTRSVTDLAGKRIYLPTIADAAAQRTIALAALGHIVLDHQPPADYAEFLAQRVEVNYFAAAMLVPERWAVGFLRHAKQAKDLEIEDLRDRYLVSYEMAAHRFTNLATTHLDIPVHFMKVNRAGIIQKAYANDGVTWPSDASGAVEGQRVCRFWTARAGVRPARLDPPLSAIHRHSRRHLLVHSRSRCR